jgi:hypothetical protein
MKPSRIGWYVFQLALTAFLVWEVYDATSGRLDNGAVATLAIVIYLTVYACTAWVGQIIDWFKSRNVKRNGPADESRREITRGPGNG